MTGEPGKAAPNAGPRRTETGEHGWFFRAITIDGRRTALRLERIFWTAIDRLAREDRVPASRIVAEALASESAGTNSASAVRQHVLHRMMDRNDKLQRHLSVDAVSHLLNACPAAACALSSERRLRLTNAAFLRFVRLNLPVDPRETSTAALRMQIDMQMHELFSALDMNGGQPVSVGFALGLQERRVRGRMNAVLAPCSEERMVLGFIVT